MKTKIFAIKDKKSTFGGLFEMASEGAAVRDFGQNVMKPAPEGRVNLMKEYPEDYSLALIGEYDTEKGIITPIEPKIIAEASQYVTKQ